MKVKFGGTPFQAWRSLYQRTLFHDPTLQALPLLWHTEVADNTIPGSQRSIGPSELLLRSRHAARGVYTLAER
jgi:hypothetical protein